MNKVQNNYDKSNRANNIKIKSTASVNYFETHKNDID